MTARHLALIVVFLIAALNLQLLESTHADGLANPCATAPAARLHIGMQARVIVDSLNLRALPAVDTGVNGRLYSGNIVTVIGGASCNGHKQWWRVETVNGVRGWVAEGTWEAFYLIPEHAADQPAPTPLEWSCGMRFHTRVCYTSE